jgi:hypothetical protein
MRVPKKHKIYTIGTNSPLSQRRRRSRIGCAERLGTPGVCRCKTPLHHQVFSSPLSQDGVEIASAAHQGIMLMSDRLMQCEILVVLGLVHQFVNIVLGQPIPRTLLTRYRPAMPQVLLFIYLFIIVSIYYYYDLIYLLF